MMSSPSTLQKRLPTQSGFTLAELLVASTLMSIALIGVYTTFHSTVLHWRNGSANEKTFTDARRVFAIMQHDLSGIPNDRRQLSAVSYFSGFPDEVSFVSAIQPMNVEELAIERLFAVRYYLNGTDLIREERPVEGPLASQFTGMAGSRPQASLRLGRKYERIIADGVLDVRLTYLWTPGSSIRQDAPPIWTPLIERPTATDRLPAGVRIELTLYDAAKSIQDTRFVKTIKFDGNVSFVPDDLEKDGGEV
ncbi:MAG: prepilin-type N-terminal cleavage/methylation domain-containing protein [Candidatus Hydrogenedentota bacterium]